MRVKIEEVGKGLHPSEVLVKIETLHGPRELVLDKRSISGNTIEVGAPIAEQGTYRLIELPAETTGGAWRVWVDAKITTNSGELEAAE
jgi:hypothetical protein